MIGRKNWLVKTVEQKIYMNNFSISRSSIVSSSSTCHYNVAVDFPEKRETRLFQLFEDEMVYIILVSGFKQKVLNAVYLTCPLIRLAFVPILQKLHPPSHVPPAHTRPYFQPSKFPHSFPSRTSGSVILSPKFTINKKKGGNRIKEMDFFFF